MYPKRIIEQHIDGAGLEGMDLIKGLDDFGTADPINFQTSFGPFVYLLNKHGNRIIVQVIFRKRR